MQRWWRSGLLWELLMLVGTPSPRQRASRLAHLHLGLSLGALKPDAPLLRLHFDQVERRLDRCQLLRLRVAGHEKKLCWLA